MTRVTGIVLAAGAGTRYGMPKARARTSDGTPWVQRVAAALRAGGCDDVVVVLGAAMVPVPDGVQTVVADDWAEGMSRSLAAGLAAARGAERIVVVPVDVPDLSGEAVARVLAAASGPGALARATYAGRPGHPAVIGAAHRDDVIATLAADRGAGAYLSAHGAVLVECGDLWSGDDVDAPG